MVFFERAAVSAFSCCTGLTSTGGVSLTVLSFSSTFLGCQFTRQHQKNFILRRCNSNPGQLGVERKHYLCAKPIPPLQWFKFDDNVFYSFSTFRKRSLVTDDESDSKRLKVGEDEDFDQVIADLVDVIDKESSSIGKNTSPFLLYQKSSSVMTCTFLYLLVPSLLVDD